MNEIGTNPREKDTAGRKQAWRVFVAIRIPDDIKRNLELWCSQQRRDLPYKKWVHPGDFHITVQFLGDVEPDAVPNIEEALKQAAAKLSPFDIGLAGTGVFGRPSQPRVLWAGIEEGMGGLNAVYKAVTEALAPLGFTPESRPYSPHVTLARKFLPDQSSKATFQGEQTDFGSWRASAIVLYRTRMERQPMYEVVAQAEFGQA